MSPEAQKYITEKESAQIDAHILRLRTATEAEIREVLSTSDLREGTSTRFIIEEFLKTQTIVRGDVQKAFEGRGGQGDVINKTMKDIYYIPASFKAPQLKDFSVQPELAQYGTKHHDKFTVMSRKNVGIINSENENEIKAMHGKLHAKAEGLKKGVKQAVADALTRQYLGVEVATLASGLEIKECQVSKAIEELNAEDLKPEGLRIAVRNGIAILTILCDDGKIYLLDTPETRRKFLDGPDFKPLSEEAPEKPKYEPHTKKKGGKGKRRSQTIAFKRLTTDEIQEGIAQDNIDTKNGRPKTRSECVDAPRPCAYVSCKYNLYLDVNPHTGSIQLNFPDTPVWEMKETCALDVADRGGVVLEKAGDLLSLTRERIRQVELIALEKLRSHPKGQDLLEGGLFEDNTDPYDMYAQEKKQK